MREKIILPNGFLALAEEELKAGRRVRVMADGDSMYPFIRGGRDEVEIAPIDPSEAPELFSCYLVKWNGRYIIHRLIGKAGDNYIFQGDRNSRNNKELIEADKFIGKLVRIYTRRGKVIECESPKWKNKARLWYRLRYFRRILAGLMHRGHLR